MTERKKYELTDETIRHAGRTLHRIRALDTIPSAGVDVGELGGYVESEKNLSHSGGCWVFGNSMVYGDAEVHENAGVYAGAVVCGNARVSGMAWVFGGELK